MSKSKLMAAAIAAVLSTGLVAAGMAAVVAADNQAKDAMTQSQEKTAEKDFIKVSEDALMTLREVRGARLAIFNGLPNKAKTYADGAVARVAATIKDADQYALDIKEPVTGDGEYVPFDASLTVAETFVPNEENMKHITKANEHLHKGEKQKAIEVLTLGEVDVAFTTRLVPLKLAQQHIDDAAKLIGEGKYYQANLALKAVEDAVVVETYEIDSVPVLKADK